MKKANDFSIQNDFSYLMHIFIFPTESWGMMQLTVFVRNGAKSRFHHFEKTAKMCEISFYVSNLLLNYFL